MEQPYQQTQGPEQGTRDVTKVADQHNMPNNQGPRKQTKPGSGGVRTEFGRNL